MKIISLFCGAGGMDIGFAKAGHQIIWANDNDPDSIKSYQEYFHKKYKIPKNHTCLNDIKNVDIKDIPDGDVVIGGFPCQGFSIANPYRKIEDSRNELYLELLRIIKGKKPKYFVAENVTGLQSIGGYETNEDKKNKMGRILKMILKDFENAGYKVKCKTLNAADFGAPQIRKRIVILGTRHDIKKELIHPLPIYGEKYGLKPYKTLGKAIYDLPEELDINYKIKNHIGTSHKVKINGFIGNRKTDPDKPSPTIVGRGGGTGGPVIIPHPNGKRRLSVRETARLQCFPDDFVFFGSISSCYRQIGNAVAWPMAYCIAKNIPIKD